MERWQRSQQGVTTYVTRYHELIVRSFNHIIYDSFIPENLRIIITRWRLSCHNLKIESGRRDPYIPRQLRLCAHCDTVEDENHALFSCIIYNTIRMKYAAFLGRII